LDTGNAFKKARVKSERFLKFNLLVEN
jgi:hypothetical protein